MRGGKSDIILIVYVHKLKWDEFNFHVCSFFKMEYKSNQIPYSVSCCIWSQVLNVSCISLF